MSFFNIWGKKQKGLYHLFILLMATCLAGTAMAKDTDIYQINTKQNAYILMDSSGSMDWILYESQLDYGAIYDYLITYNDSVAPYSDYIYDIVNWNDALYNNHEERTKIYLIQGNPGVNILSIDGQTVAVTGDAGRPSIIWQFASIIDTHTLIDSEGNLSHDGGADPQRVTTDANGHILLDGQTLPIGQDVALHDLVTMYDGSQVDEGFGGLLHAPGHYFSGLETVGAGAADHNTAEDGDWNIYFFVTGNWINMQQMLNLAYTTNNPEPAGAHNGDPAWKYEPVPLSAAAVWATLNCSKGHPASGTYANNLDENDLDVVQTIVHPAAQEIKVHFSAFDVEGDGNTNTYTNDYVALYNANGDLVTKYDNDNKPTDGDGWSATVSGDTVRIKLSSNAFTVGTGYRIDRYKVVNLTDPYVLQSRLDVAKEAMLHTLDEFHGKMNWGYATFNGGNGATVNCALNPNLTDDANRAAIINHVDSTTASGATPLGEALQDVWFEGYYIKRSSLDNLSCRKNYIISVTDGFPADDTEWDRIDHGNVVISDFDGDGFTGDPAAGNVPNYYDDVAHWLYTHNWQADGYPEVTDPAESYVNVITHHLAFTAKHPLLQDAAEESGGEYITAYNKSQLVAAFYALALQMTEAVAFTAPVVSVDAANKIQNGDDIYLGLFLPQDSQGWMGNLKKFKLGDGSTDRPNVWMFYDGADSPAIDSSGNFLDNTAAFWGDDNDANDVDNFGSQDVREDGAGEVLTERVQANYATANYYERPIYTSINGAMTKVDRNNITAARLNVADDLTRDQIINYVHGYTYTADAATGAPLGVRDWALGAIIHSSPVVVDYYDPADTSILLKRYLVVGANDGMLHVFDDADGSEIFAFIPEDILPELRKLPTNPLVETVDGNIALYRTDIYISNKTINNPKYLIFGLRRGGRAYWCLDIQDTNPLNWTVKWSYDHNDNSELGQSWAKPQITSIPVSLDSGTGKVTFKDILVLTGGYDPMEDDYPEPFFDGDQNGKPYMDNGQIAKGEWDKNDGTQDVNDNDAYDEYNPGMNDFGRGVFAVDIDNPTAVVSVNGTQVLPFSVTYGASDNPTGHDQTLTDMKFCFPATPALLASTFSYFYTDGAATVDGRKSNVLNFVYATDIYANICKVAYQFEIVKSGGTFSLQKKGWQVAKIFSGNPGSNNTSGSFGGSDDVTDTGRKAFYAPAVSWGGSGDYFDAGNYGFSGTTFSGRENIASLFIGTGDREHPSYTMIRNRIYAIYDDTSVTAEDTATSAPVKVSTAPYDENDLLNLSHDELDEGTTLSGGITRAGLRADLTDDATYALSGIETLENGINENDAKGWYIVLEDQEDSLAGESHEGEKILAEIGLYAGVLYLTSYQPSTNDPCNPQGNGFAYALNYDDGTAAYNLNPGNNLTDVTDRYRKFIAIRGLPSKFAIILRKGQAGAMAMMGGQVIGPRPPGPGDPGFKIKSPGLGLELYYWREGNSQKQ